MGLDEDEDEDDKVSISHNCVGWNHREGGRTQTNGLSINLQLLSVLTGKTVVSSLLLGRLESRKGLVCVRFQSDEPWMPSDSEQPQVVPDPVVGPCS